MITDKQFKDNATPTNPDAKLRKGAVISSVCEHPQIRREYYRDKCYKCWECLKIVVEQTDL
jgi:hypothetical protein